MLLEEISPFIRFCNRYNWRPYSHFSICLDCRLFHIKSGEGEIVIEGEKYFFEKNTLILFQGGTKYKFIVREPINIISVNFDFTQNNNRHISPYAPVLVKNNETVAFDIEKLMFENAQVLEKPIVIKNFSTNGILKDMLSEISIKQPFYIEKTSLLLKNLLIDIVRTATLSEQSNLENKLNAVISYIQENYDENITNEKLAKLVNYHPYYLNRVFKKYTGVTLHKYLLDYRIRMAENMLLSTEITVEKIAEQVGFNSTTCFISYFKKAKLLTPSQYRNKIIKAL